MTDFLALTCDYQVKNMSCHTLIQQSATPRRLYWCILDANDAVLARDFVDCRHDFSCAQECVELVKEAMAYQIGVDVQQIKYVDGTIKPLPFPKGDNTTHRQNRKKRFLH
ncbi:MAG: hypothetical protein JXA89_15050 [Anaerolineae bacterium]|nr:hypothetical protein [Anaerolineae bacterium]